MSRQVATTIGSAPDQAYDAGLAGDYNPAVANERTLMTLETLRAVFKDNADDLKVINAVAKAEADFTLEAMRALHPGEDASGAMENLAKRLRDKHGSGMDGVVKYAEILKKKVVEAEGDAAMFPVISRVMAKRGYGAGAGVWTQGNDQKGGNGGASASIAGSK